MNRLKALHDDVKTSYEHGDYQTATQAYQDWQRMTADDQHLRDDDPKDDYQRGYQGPNRIIRRNTSFKTFQQI
ncbi:hypothetical protein MUDAN_DOGOELCO_02827 [Lactiplantibacillus mudanjiangensis]|uniref:hypothetical protein n=1 Tax=Lactiplantibacillus mudanjiangensis TaxID=1296538 RepID=UPI001014FECE|nr:hypothetical protein [Lactiplantibacillus mudanjiangensis]VDG33685.1 hypothetical protein MUDAN_DOGOELCO_02827 [Lactiplantibacillus mudanjiangensis]